MAERGWDRLEAPGDKYNEDPFGEVERLCRDGFLGVAREISEIASPGTVALSFAVCIDGTALGTRGHVPPYQLLVDRGCVYQCRKSGDVLIRTHSGRASGGKRFLK